MTKDANLNAAYDVFISCASENVEVAQRIYDFLEGKNIHCWLYRLDDPAGGEYPGVIDRAITKARIFVLVLSKYSSDSQWVRKETTLAVNLHKTIIPFRIEDCALEGAMRISLIDLNWIDAFPQQDQAFGLLADAVQRYLEETPAVPEASAAESRIVSDERLNKLFKDFEELSREQGGAGVELLLKICESIRANLAGFSVPGNDNRSISEVAEKAFRHISINEADLNSARSEIARCFSAFGEAMESSTAPFAQFIFKGFELHRKDEYDLPEIVSEIVDSVTGSETDHYVEYRDQLIRLLDEFIDKKIDVEGEHTPELKAIRKRLKESQFEIALIGEFQGGKSTTFNMLCGGREISPRGLNGGGIKTSAAVITAQNIGGNEEKDGLAEWAEITWLTREEIKRRVLYVVKNYNNGARPLLAAKLEETPLKNIQELLKSAWKKNPQDDEQRDLLRVATLQYRLLVSPRLDEFLSRKIVPVDKFQELVTFPQEWETRWCHGGDAEFTPEESLFSIVDRVLVRIHSEALAKLGCRITDCPGLFVSQWDTERAIEVMRSANAIWYLLSGDKQIGENDQRVLKKIKVYGWQDKCFFSVNRRKGRESTRRIADTDMAILKNAGFNPERIFKYDAFLAFRCAQADILADHHLAPKDCECLAQETCRSGKREDISRRSAEFRENPRKCSAAIKRMLEKHLMTLDEEELVDDLEDEEILSPELRASLLLLSGRMEILDVVEKLIITRRARSILVSEGSKKCLEVLEHFTGNLLDRERAAEQTWQEAQEKAAEAQKKLGKFIEEWKEHFEFLNSDSLDDGLAMDFFAENDAEIRETITARAVDICKEEWHGKHYDASAVSRATEERIQNEFLDLVRAKLDCYRREITSKPKFMESVGRPFSDRLEKMGARWEELKNENDLFKTIRIISHEDIGELTFDSFNEKLNGTVDVPWYSWEFLKDVLTLGIRRLFQTPDGRIEEFFRKNDPVGYAYNAFKGDHDNEKQIAYALGAQRRLYVGKIAQAFDHLSQRLEQSIRERERIVRQSNAERERIAREAKEKRENIVEPYTRKIQLFQDEVCSFYGGTK